jgi:hypothetical protein
MEHQSVNMLQIGLEEQYSGGIPEKTMLLSLILNCHVMDYLDVYDKHNVERGINDEPKKMDKIDKLERDRDPFQNVV